MKKINFENLPSTNTPINATNLNLMQDNFEEAITAQDITDELVYPTEYSSTKIKFYKFGSLIHLEGTITVGSNITSGQAVLSIPTEYAPKVSNNFAVVGGGGTLYPASLSSSGNLVVYGETSWLGFSINWII